MRKLLIAFSLALLIFSCNDDDVSNDNDNNNENGIKEDPTFTVTYQLDAPIAKPPDFKPTHELLGDLPVDNNKYKSGDTVTVLSTDIKLKEIATGEINRIFDCWGSLDFKDKSFWIPGDEFTIEKNVIFYATAKYYFGD